MKYSLIDLQVALDNNDLKRYNQITDYFVSLVSQGRYPEGYKNTLEFQRDFFDTIGWVPNVTTGEMEPLCEEAE